MIRKLRAREPNWAVLMKAIKGFSSLKVDLSLWKPFDKSDNQVNAAAKTNPNNYNDQQKSGR